MVALTVGFSKVESDFKKSKTMGTVIPSRDRISFASKKMKNLDK